jgi:prefoldin subunit 5
MVTPVIVNANLEVLEQRLANLQKSLEVAQNNIQKWQSRAATNPDLARERIAAN